MEAVGENLDGLLDDQTVALLHGTGYYDLRVGSDGSIYGALDVVIGQPEVLSVKLIVQKQGGREVKIEQEIVGSVTDVGSII